ncbi:DUF1844 domain-containing protein, partial [Candidatus Omnitrophota bacterium]
MGEINGQEKKVDESWKDKVEEQKQIDPETAHEDAAFVPPEVNLVNFVSSLSIQTLIALGQIESPLSGKKEKNIQQAQFLIDTLDMIKDKTIGNLTLDEANFLEN